MALFVISVAFLASSVYSTHSCELPPQLAGVWNTTLTSLGWSNVEVNATSFKALPTTSRGNKDFNCFLRDNNTYIIKSTPVPFFGFAASYYLCLDVVPSGSNPDVVFFRPRTNRTSDDYPYEAVLDSNTIQQNFSYLCAENATTFPLLFSMLLKQGFQDRVGASHCPSSLQSQFAANLSHQLQPDQCPNGFWLDGCADKSQLTFNYTSCGNNASSFGVVNYTCLSTTQSGNKTYTSIFLHNHAPLNNPYEFSCLESELAAVGQLNLTKSAGTCGAASPVMIVANETLSCRVPSTPAPTTQSGTTTPGPNVTVTTQAPPASTGGPGSGDGGDGKVNSATAVYFGLVSMLLLCLPFIFSA